MSGSVSRNQAREEIEMAIHKGMVEVTRRKNVLRVGAKFPEPYEATVYGGPGKYRSEEEESTIREVVCEKLCHPSGGERWRYLVVLEDGSILSHIHFRDDQLDLDFAYLRGVADGLTFLVDRAWL